MTFTMNDVAEAWRTCLIIMFSVGACIGVIAAVVQIAKALFYDSDADDYRAGMRHSDTEKHTDGKEEK